MAKPDAPYYGYPYAYGYRFKPSVDDDLMANSEAVTESPMYAAHPGYKYRLYGKRSAEPETDAGTRYCGYLGKRSAHVEPETDANIRCGNGGYLGKRSVDDKPQTEADARRPRYYYG
jgi:hypothetical protein